MIHSSFYFSLLKSHKPEFSLFYENSCDSISHQFWNEWKTYSPLSFAISGIYHEIDKFIGKIMEFSQKNNYSIMIISDHGFKANEDLENFGYLRIIRISRFLSFLDLEEELYGAQLDNYGFFRRKPHCQKNDEYFINLFKSVKYRERDLFTVKKYGNNFIIKVDPEVMPLINRNDIITGLNKKKATAEKILEFDSNRFGAHSNENGVFIFWGPNIKNVNINPVKPYDILPIILAHLGSSIPKQLDGKVIKAVFEKVPNLKYYDYERQIQGKRDQKIEREKEKIKKHLKSLKNLKI